MVRLNRHKLTEQQLADLFTQLNNTLGKLRTFQTGNMLSELLGNEERIMLAKRLAILVLLLEGKSMYRIAKTLKVSPSTIEKTHARLKNNEYEHTIKILGSNKKDYFIFLDTLDKILHLGGTLPHYNGLDRYKGL